MKKLATLLLTLLAATLITGCSNKSAEIDRLVKKVDREEKRVSELNEINDKLTLANLKLQEQIDRLNSKVSDYESQINDFDGDSSNLQQTIKDLKQENEDLKNQLANSKTSSSSSASSSNSSSSSNINDLRNQINVLNADLSNYKSKCEILQQQLDSQIAVNKNSAATSYIANKFWYDGNTYTSPKTTWYSKITCESGSEITGDVIIVSPNVDPFKQSNGYTVYCCMSTNGFVYSSNTPYLTKIKTGN